MESKIVKIDLSNDSISDLTMDDLLKLQAMVKTSIALAKKNSKKKKPVQGLLFDTVATNVEIKTTFEKSNAGIWSIFEKELFQAEQMGVDISFYYEGVKNWSLKKPTLKRTARGWIATALDFMRSDKQKNKLAMVNNIPAGSESSDAMKAYLNL